MEVGRLSIRPSSGPDAEGGADAPLVSVLVPCYNRELYIEEALLSILEQDYPNFELIVVDDGSQDGSAQRIEALRERYGFQFYRQQNQGVSAALNTALKYARGQYIATPDSDDVMLPGRLALQVAYLEQHPEVGCVGAGVVYVDANGRRLKAEKCKPIRAFSFSELLATARAVGAPVAMYRREAMDRVGGYDPQIRIQDFQMTLKIAYLGYRVDILPDLVTLYRKHPGNMSTTAYKRQLDYDLMAIAPYQDHPGYLPGLTCVMNKALKHSVVSQKGYALGLLMKIPPWRWNRVTWRRIRQLVFKFRE
ncbi:Chondroitin polymerase [Pseudomonas putida]|nr:Chondroitin polymerase [Pseudomonas putida]CAB5539877.1 Chondroitin polymerase [Pseudomonas putida]CAB5579790.1 Chondroitin polymerase [Pseudomonas putida]CAB5588983.1 Chondroitin polymerase [Pseudomonas putida]CAB5668071.1 Chondroitin polymerase [Pseudomonas putida]